MLNSTIVVAGAALRALWRRPDGTLHEVAMIGDGFVPAEITVARGDRVFFVNRDKIERNATATDATFDTGRLAPGVGVEVTVTGAGAVRYFCRIQPAHRGVIVCR